MRKRYTNNNNNNNKYNRLLYRSIHLLYSHFLLCYLFIVYQVYIVARCSNTNSHPVISYKIVTTYRGVFQKKKKIGSPGRCFAEPPNEYITRARGEASRMGHEKFPGELKYTSSYRILRAEMYETTTNVRYDVLRGGWGYIKCRYLISGSDAV